VEGIDEHVVLKVEIGKRAAVQRVLWGDMVVGRGVDNIRGWRLGGEGREVDSRKETVKAEPESEPESKFEYVSNVDIDACAASTSTSFIETESVRIPDADDILLLERPPSSTSARDSLESAKVKIEAGGDPLSKSDTER
jgi:hypothetical protein